MDNIKTYSAAMGECVKLVNTDQDVEDELNVMMSMTVEDALHYILGEMPEAIRKLRMSTLMDLMVNWDAFEDLDELEEEDE